MKKYNEIIAPYQFEEFWSKYPHGYSIYEALLDWLKTVNIMIEDLNFTNEQLESFYSITLPDVINDVMEQWSIDGKWDDIVNVDILGGVRDDLDDVTADLISKFTGLVNAKDFLSIKEAFEASINKTLLIPAGTYSVGEEISLVGNINVVCLGPVVLDGQLVTSLDDTPLLKIDGVLKEESYTITSDIKKGDKQLTLTSTTGLNDGDVLLLESSVLWNIERPEYIKGELVVVDKVINTTVVNLVTSIYDDYTSSEINISEVWKPSVVNIKGSLTILRSGASNGVQIRRSTGKIEQLHVKRANDRGLIIDYCTNLTIQDCLVYNELYVGAGRAYGLTINSGYNIHIQGGNFRAGRHGVSHGGWIPGRNIKHVGVTCDNDVASLVEAFDSHGNVEFLTVDGLFSANGFHSSASNLLLINSVIKGIGSNKSLRIIVERSCDFITIKNTSIESISNLDLGEFTSRSLLNIVDSLTLENITVKVPLSDVVSNSKTGVLTFDKIITKNTIVDNFMYDSLCKGGTLTYVLEFVNTFGYENLLLNNINIINSSLGGLGVTVGVPESNVFVKNSFIRSSTASPVSVVGGGSGYFINTTFDGNNLAARLTLNHVGRTSLDNVTFLNFVSNCLRVRTSQDVYVSNVNLINAGVGLYESILPHYAKSHLGNKQFSSSAVPTVGTYAKGDHIVNSAPAIGQPKGWLCTVAGTPGTWVSEGNL